MRRLMVGIFASVLSISQTRAEPPVIVAPQPVPTGKVGEPYFYDFDITPVPQIFSVHNLPPGLQENPSDYSFAGTPTQAGSFDVVIQATSFEGENAQVTRRITIEAADKPNDSVVPKMRIAGASYLKVGEPNLYRFVFFFEASDNLEVSHIEFRGAVSNGDFDEWKTYPYLPDQPFEILLSCTAFRLQVRAVDTADNRSKPEQYDFTAQPGVTGGGTAKGTVGEKFVYRIKGPGIDKVTAKGLPPGCKLSKSGVIRGRPRKAGTFRVKVTTSSSGGSSTQTLKIRIKR